MPPENRTGPVKNELLQAAKDGVSIAKMSREFGIGRSTIKDALTRWGAEDNRPERDDKPADTVRAWAPPEQETPLVKFKERKTFLITSVLNDCGFPTQALKAAEIWAKQNDGQIIAIPVRYKNVSLYSTPQAPYWPSEFDPYYLTEDLELCSNLVIMGSMRIQATAARPLSGTAGCSKAKSAVFGHPRLALETIATPGNQLPTVQFTTGTISYPSYSDTKAGRLGEFHHTMSAAIVEVEGDLFWWRHVHFDKDGSFIDFGEKYTFLDSMSAPRAEAIIMGDIHVDFTDKKVQDAILSDLCEETNPANVVWHDVLDFFSGSHHHERNPVLKALKASRNRDNVAEELERVAMWIQENTFWNTTFHIIDSNHHNHLDRWLDNHSDKIDAKNLLLWHKLNAGRLEQALQNPNLDNWDMPSAFKMAMDLLVSPNIRPLLRFHGSNEPLLFHGIDCGNHGDRGPNGARGSAQVFANTQRKTVIGHSHQPKIRDGCFQVGKTCVDRLPYMHGYSSHLSCSCIINGDGSRTLFPVIDGRYRRDVPHRANSSTD